MYYTGQEIMGIAVRIEENGNAFYAAAAEILKGSPDTQNLFLDLAEKEIMHIAIFQKLAEKFEAEEFDFDPNEVNDYVANLADQHIFGKPDAGTSIGKNHQIPKEALDIAFKFENDSVAFYTRA